MSAPRPTPTDYRGSNCTCVLRAFGELGLGFIDPTYLKGHLGNDVRKEITAILGIVGCITSNWQYTLCNTVERTVTSRDHLQSKFDKREGSKQA
jgi:hypothetical protein